MSAEPEAGAKVAPQGKSRKKLILIAAPVLLVGVVAGLWFSGILPGMLGMGARPPAQHAEAAPQPEPVRPPALFDMP